LGERHGLKHLLDASRRSQIPLTLLDLKTPASLSALDALGKMQQIAEMQHQGLLILPDTLPENYFGVLPEWILQQAIYIGRQISLAFGFKSSSQFVYAPFASDYLPTDYELTFLRTSLHTDEALPTTQIVRGNDDQRLLPIPLAGETIPQATDQGLPIELRRFLLHSGLSPGNERQIAILGGDLPQSTWGDPRAVQATLEYIAHHPWMKVLNEKELLAQQICEDCPALQQHSSATFDHPVVKALQQAPENSITDLALQMFLDLSVPAVTFEVEELAALRANYLGEIGNLLTAAKWEQTRTNLESTTRDDITIDCSQDTDFDTQTECILANENFFALLDPEGGRLSYLFTRGPEEVSQLLGPSSQFIVGLSDLRTWDLTAGSFADPSNIPGAFSVPWEIHQVEIMENGIRFSTQGVEKIFQLTINGLRVEIHGEGVQTYQIPLAVAPEMRFQPGWMGQYEETKIPQGFIWGIADGPKVEIRSSGEISSHKFQDSQLLLGKPEDPDFGYPPGHFIPFPMVILDLSAQSELWVEFSLGSE
jgi:hypothetical protein